MTFVRTTADGVVVTVRLTPRADRDAIGAVKVLADGRAVLAVRVRAVPEDGAANAALVALIAKKLKVPKSAVALVSGETQRVKQLTIAGDAKVLAAKLSAVAEGRDYAPQA